MLLLVLNIIRSKTVYSTAMRYYYLDLARLELSSP